MGDTEHPFWVLTQLAAGIMSKKLKKTKKKKEPVTVDNFDVRNFVEKTLRGAFKKSPLYNEALKRAKEEYFEESKNGKPMRRVHYKCAGCGNFFIKGRKVDGKTINDVAVDHIEPVLDVKYGWQGYDIYVDRLFCDINNLQVLCNFKGERNGVKSCHKIKTAEESAEAAFYRKRAKELSNSNS